MSAYRSDEGTEKKEKSGRIKKTDMSLTDKNISPKVNSFLSNVLVRILISLIMAAFGAVLLTLSFAPYGMWPFIFFAFVPILTATHRIAPRRFSGFVMALGTGLFFRIFFDGFFNEGDFILGNYMYVFVALFFLAAGFLQRAFHSRSKYRWFVIEGVVFWIGFEMLRGFIPGLGTTGFLATALYKQFWFIQPVSMMSIYGLSMLIIFINYTLTYVVIAFIDSRITFKGEVGVLTNKSARRWVYFAFAAFIGWFAFSLSLLQSPLPALRASAVQPGHYVHETVFSGEMRKMFRRSIEFQEDFDELLRISRRAASENARLIVWNEATLPFNPHLRGTEEVQEFVKDTGVYLVLGYRVPEDRSEGVTIISPDGVFLGESYQTLIGSIGTAVSDDIDRTSSFREISSEGTRIVALSTFHSSKQGPRRLPNVVFRAVENHLSVVKADAHYASAIIDPYGRLIQYSSSESSTRRILVADIPAGSGNTLVVMWGDWLGWLSLGGMIFFIIIMTVSQLRARKRKELNAQANPQA